MTLRALSLHQPWASAVADGVKLWETRSWSTKHRGPLAICSTKAAPAQPLIYGQGKPMPRGFVLAVVDLVDVLPIGDSYSFSTGIFEGEECPTAGLDVVVRHPRLSDRLPESLWWDRWGGQATVEISDQLPWGDFTPGRWAWHLDAIRPLPEPVPVTGRQGIFTLPVEVEALVGTATRA